MGSGRWRRGVKGQQKANPSQFSHTKISGFTTATKVAFRIFVGAHATLTKTRCFGSLGSQKNPYLGFTLLLYIIFCILFLLFWIKYHFSLSIYTMSSGHSKLLSLGPSVFYLGPLSLSLSLSISIYRSVQRKNSLVFCTDDQDERASAETRSKDYREEQKNSHEEPLL